MQLIETSAQSHPQGQVLYEDELRSYAMLYRLHPDMVSVDPTTYQDKDAEQLQLADWDVLIRIGAARAYVFRYDESTSEWVLEQVFREGRDSEVVYRGEIKGE